MDYQTWASMPVDADPDRDIPVGMTEWGDLIYQTRYGQQYFMTTAWQEPLPGEPWSRERIGHVLGGFGMGLMNSAVNAFTAPSRAWLGEPMTNGDMMDTAGLAQLGSLAGTAPAGAMRSGLARTGKTVPQTLADEIMEKLRTGRGAQVTDDMMAAADQPYLSSIYDLPMDNASRMQRAADAGFRTNMPLYHGSATDFSGFDMSHAGKVTDNPAARRAIWLADDPSVADEFAHLAAGNGRTSQQVYPVLHKADRPTSGRLPADATNESVALTLDDAFGSGRDAVRLQDYTTPRGEVGKNIFAIKDPTQIRSIFARFDPRLSHLSNLTASNASPTAGLFGLGRPIGEEDTDALKQYLSEF